MTVCFIMQQMLHNKVTQRKGEMMNYRLATYNDIDLLVMERMHFIEVDESDEAYEAIKYNCYLYFRKALANETCDVILAEDNGLCIGTGIVFYYDSVPSAFNVSGKNAYITSMYVKPDYRCKGIGTMILEQIVTISVNKGYNIIMLNASNMGRTLYQRMGFVESENGMIFVKERA